MELLVTILKYFFQILVGIFIFPLIAVVGIFQSIFSRACSKAKDINGEIAVVTGGGNGLGKHICIQLALKGCHVAVVDIDLKGAEETADLLQKKYNIKSKAYKIDVANRDEVMKLSENVAKDLGDVTILVNNAAKLFLSSYPPDWREVQQLINVNLVAHFWALEAFLPRMKELKKGHIVAIASMSAYVPLVNFSQYTAAKFGVRGLMGALRQELLQGKFNTIHATTISPLFMDSNSRVKSIITSCKNIFWLIKSEDAAVAIVKAILLNEKEVFMPFYMGFLSRIHACLPISLQDLTTYILTKQFTLDIIK